MWMNLLSNAIKYSPGRGEVRVAGAVAEDGSFRLSISDTGIGMSGKEILEAFEPFRRIDHALTSNFEGIGIGLPLTKPMIAMIGGRTETDSLSNLGTPTRRGFTDARVPGTAEPQQRTQRAA